MEYTKEKSSPLSSFCLHKRCRDIRNDNHEILCEWERNIELNKQDS